ncbi:hypothetical protein Taro_007835 [Colocasia esculenta]|uniref:Kazal-like domain-containing protein n=1 Tax=Colocasia esculenta TaxID=4460 RepID=A0A843TS85_COLES|nr:hypothetical protein [Colocasia esculenta]
MYLSLFPVASHREPEESGIAAPAPPASLHYSFSPPRSIAFAMATDAGARPWGLLLLLALSLCFSISEVRADTVNLCGLSPPAARGKSCQINCFRYDPVCGNNGVTYGCGCPEADCNGVPVVKLGEC